MCREESQVDLKKVGDNIFHVDLLYQREIKNQYKVEFKERVRGLKELQMERKKLSIKLKKGFNKSSKQEESISLDLTARVTRDYQNVSVIFVIGNRFFPEGDGVYWQGFIKIKSPRECKSQMDKFVNKIENGAEL